jgi:hypothetical protein
MIYNGNFDQDVKKLCQCGENGHPLNSVNCDVHGYITVPKSQIRLWQEQNDKGEIMAQDIINQLKDYK